MQKEELLQSLRESFQRGEITKEEVDRVFIRQDELEGDSKKHHFPVTKLLYALGIAIALLGLSTFIAQVWDSIGGVGRVVVTLGIGGVLAAFGSMLLQSKPESKIGLIFHFLGGVLIPGGVMVLLSELNIDFVSVWPFAITFTVLAGMYTALAVVHKRALLTLFAIIFGTTAIYLITEAILPGPSYRHDDVYAYLTMAIGVSYLLAARAIKESWNKRLERVLEVVGGFGFYIAAFTRVFDSGFWQFLYFLLIFGGLYLSVLFRSTRLLIISTLALVLHISYITGEYFANSLGWPISLIILGFIFIGLGYSSVTINKKFIKGEEVNNLIQE